jgi:hypothetical protein
VASSASLYEFTDRELLHMVGQLEAGDGWAHVQDLANLLGLEHKNPTRCVSSRLGRMRKLGTVERSNEEPGLYRLTELGEAVADGRMRAAQRRALSRAEPNELVALMQALGDQFLEADFEHALLMRRSWAPIQKRRKFR